VWTLPDLAGQPGWVVVVVTALFTAGTLGAAWLRKRSPGEIEPAEGDAEASELEAGAVPSIQAAPQDGATSAIHNALAILAAEANESREARAETDRIRKELEAVREDLRVARVQLERAELERSTAATRLLRCEARVELLTEQAQHRGGTA